MPKNRDFLKSKRGLHPASIVIFLVAALLLLAGTVYIWTTIQNRAGHSIQIQSVSLQATRTRIYVQNTGVGTVTIGSVQIDNDQFNISADNCTVESENTTTLNETSTAVITVDHSYQGAIHVKVACVDGTSHELDYKPQDT
jgi:paraquat-inducible protein B